MEPELVLDPVFVSEAELGREVNAIADNVHPLVLGRGDVAGVEVLANGSEKLGHFFLRGSVVVPIPTNFYIISCAHDDLHKYQNFFSLPPPGKALSTCSHER